MALKASSWEQRSHALASGLGRSTIPFVGVWGVSQDVGISILPQLEMRPSANAPNPVWSREAPPTSSFPGFSEPPCLHLQDASSTRQLGDQVASRLRPGPPVTSRAPGSMAFQFPSLQAPAFLRHDPTSLLNRFLLQRPSRSVQTWSVNSRCKRTAKSNITPVINAI